MKLYTLLLSFFALFAVSVLATPIPWDHQQKDQGKTEQIAGGSNNEGNVEGLLNNILKDGILNKHVTTSEIYQCSNGAGSGSSTQAAGGSNNEGQVSGIGNNILKGGVLNYNVENTKVYQINCKTGDRN